MDAYAFVFYLFIGIFNLVFIAAGTYTMIQFGKHTYDILSQNAFSITGGELRFMMIITTLVGFQIAYSSLRMFIQWTKVFTNARKAQKEGE